MKLHVVLIPSNKLLNEPGSVGAILKSADLKGLNLADKATELTIDIEAPDTAEFPAELAVIARALEENFAKGAADGAQLRIDIATSIGEARSSASESNNPVPATTAQVPWTPDSQKLHDVNGSRANAALPRVLAALGDSADETITKVTVDSVDRHVMMVRDRSVRFGRRDPERGALISVAECLRRLTSRGAAPLAIGYEVVFPASGGIDDLRKINSAIKGLSGACAYFALPAIVSLRLDTKPGEAGPVSEVWILGCFEQERHITGSRARTAGDRLMFLGEAASELGGSTYLAAVHGLTVGDSPAVQMGTERKLQNVLLTLIRAGVISAARSIAAGGVVSAVCELLFAEGRTFGARLDLTPLGGQRADALLFGESQGCVVVTVPAERIGTVLSEAHMRGVSAALIGDVTNESTLGLKTRSLETEWIIADLRARREEPSGAASSAKS